MTDEMVEKRFLKLSHEVGFELLSALDEACEATGTAYYIFYGTLLGSIRHRDWIPWDDDVDVAMFRQDFEKFRRIANDHLPNHIRFSDARSDQNHLTPIPRLLHLKTERAQFEDHVRKTRAPETIHVALDIFLLDEAPADPRLHTLWRTKIRLLEKMIIASGTDVYSALTGTRRLSRRLIETAGVIVSRSARSCVWRRRYVNACRAYETSTSRYVSLTNGWTLRTRGLLLPVSAITILWCGESTR
jgi:hypothetical protein